MSQMLCMIGVHDRDHCIWLIVTWLIVTEIQAWITLYHITHELPVSLSNILYWTNQFKINQQRTSEANKSPKGSLACVWTWLGIALFIAAGDTDSWESRDLESEPSPGRSEGRKLGPGEGPVREFIPMYRTESWRNVSRQQGEGQWSNGHQRSPRQSTACPDPWKQHIERECWEQASMHTWTCLTKGWDFCLGMHSFKGDTFGKRKGEELAGYKSRLCQETRQQAETAGTWRAEAHPPPEMMILVLGRQLAKRYKAWAWIG